MTTDEEIRDRVRGEHGNPDELRVLEEAEIISAGNGIYWVQAWVKVVT